MDNEIDFKSLWQGQLVSQPNMKDLLLKLKHFKRSNLRKLITLNIAFAATGGFIIFIWYYYQPHLLTTKVGIILIILAMTIYLFSNNKLFSTFNKLQNTQTNYEYLENLITIKSKQEFMQTTMLNLYYIMLSIGICLYMFEYTLRMTTFWRIFAYAITLAWIGFNWFYNRPQTIKKQEAKLEELINKFQSMITQLKET